MCRGVGALRLKLIGALTDSYRGRASPAEDGSSIGGTVMADQPRRERRAHERFRLNAMYTCVQVEPKSQLPRTALTGHAYDLSESGVRIELDQALQIGESVKVHLDLAGGERDIAAAAEVVWLNDLADDPGPRRMALRFTTFHSPADRARLITFLGRGFQRVAA